jgi:hypothetical protein
MISNKMSPFLYSGQTAPRIRSPRLCVFVSASPASLNGPGASLNVGSGSSDVGSGSSDVGSGSSDVGSGSSDVGSASDGGSGAFDGGSGASDGGSGASDGGSGASDGGALRESLERRASAKPHYLMNNGSREPFRATVALLAAARTGLRITRPCRAASSTEGGSGPAGIHAVSDIGTYTSRAMQSC